MREKMRKKMGKLKRKVSQVISLSLVIVGMYMLIASIISPYGVYEIKNALGIMEESDTEQGVPNKGSIFNENSVKSLEKIGATDIKDDLLREKTYCHESIEKSRCLAIVKKTAEIVPDNILSQVMNNGFDIILVDGNLREMVYEETGWDAGWQYDGVMFPDYAGYRRIWSSRKGASDVLIHEIGHAYDFSLDRVSETNEFKSIYENEARRLFPLGGLFASSEREYFAESFKFYLKYPIILKWFAPQTFDYLDSLLS